MGPEKGGQIQDETKSQQRLLQREIPLPPIRRFVRRAASFWSVTFFILFFVTTSLLIFSFIRRCEYWSNAKLGTVNGGVVAGRIFIREFCLVGSQEAFDLLCQQRPSMKPRKDDGQFRIMELRGGISLHRDVFFPDILDWTIRIYHSDCDHPNGANCILNGTYFRERYFSLPIIYFNLLFLILAIIFARRSYRRTRPGCCRCCGYSMIGNESGVCPECGSDKGANPMDDANALSVCSTLCPMIAVM